MSKLKNLVDEEIKVEKKVKTKRPLIVDEDLEADSDSFNMEAYMLKSKLPLGVDVEETLEYGFYEYKNRIWIRRKEDYFESVSNFTIKVLYLIVGANPKRIVEITNVWGKSAVLDFSIEDLISLEKFKGRVEAVGNFLFEGKANDLSRIKNKLYNKEKPSLEISTLGQQRDKFYAFANGIYDGQKFYDIDEKGMLTYGEDNYYIPVFGSTQADDDEDLRNYRKFIHRPTTTTLETWSAQLVKVYGNNAKMAIAFTIAALFRDIVFEKLRANPMMFLFGQRGSGKGTLAISIMNLFGQPQDPLMLGGASTVVGFMRKLGQFYNSIVWLDEYKNDIGEKKIESLKNIWDGIGYERGVKDSSNKTQTTPVRSAAILSGQEMPNVEPALFSRLVLLEFMNKEFTDADIQNYNDLKVMEDNGITNVTLELLRLRPIFKEKFMAAYQETAKMMRAGLMGRDIVERQIVNYCCLIACIRCIESFVKLPFKSPELYIICEKQLLRQSEMMRTANEVQQFFEMVGYLLSTREITEGVDIQFAEGFVKLRLVSIFPLYRQFSRMQGIKALDKGTLVNYIHSSIAYSEIESKKSAHRFSGMNSPTTALVFQHEDICRHYGINLKEISQNVDNQEVNNNSPY
jgi:hypothetical protein